MFRRLRTFFDGKPLVGDQVTVLSGPYRGRPGTIIAVDQGRSTVYIDECCQPRLSARRVSPGMEWALDAGSAARKVRDNDPEGDWARYLLDQKRWRLFRDFETCSTGSHGRATRWPCWMAPYAGKAGTVTAVNGHEFTVYIDECCQPQLTEASLRRVRRGGRVVDLWNPANLSPGLTRSTRWRAPESTSYHHP